MEHKDTEKHKDTEHFWYKAYITYKKHPHFWATCVCLWADKTQVWWAMKFRNMNTDEEFYVFDWSMIQWLAR